MKTDTNLPKSLLHSAAVAIVIVTGALLLMGQRAAQREQYRVITVAAGENPAVLQTQLNELGAEGWKVRSGVGNWLVLAADR
ncbi:MAG TPA: hypothetical protein VFG14_15005 [Chthoniobacteraceae bacterium]|nr:hypothetical protein [Chthoniobacteraceae bacterium]